MTVTVYLVRHAAHDDVGAYLAGRTPGIRLGAAGREQAERLGRRLARERFSAILASPRERTQETAAAIADATGIGPVETVDALDEVDFGPWAGRRFDELDADPAWRRWNAMRSLARAPGGETMLEVQGRMIGVLEAIQDRFAEDRVLLVSHSDPIKTLVMHVLGLPLDAWPRFEISPASMTVAVIGEWGGKIVTLNEVTP